MAAREPSRHRLAMQIAALPGYFRNFETSGTFSPSAVARSS